MKRVLGVIADIIVYLLFSISVLLAFSAFWMLKTWPNLKMDELVFQLNQGFGGTGSDMIGSYMKTAGIPALIVMLLMAVVLFMRRYRRWFQRLCLTVSAICCVLISGTTVYKEVDVEEYVVSQTTESEFIKDNYADPASTVMTFPEQKRNLIYIFLESMETTFADEANGGAFETNIITELTELAEENETFSGSSEQLNGGYSLPGTTWTMGGMFAETSGLPLQISINGNAMEDQKQFFPGIQTIGDVLEDEGYKNVLLIGSNAVFGGRKVYFESHGNYEIRDYNYANDNGLIDKDYYVFWGYEDNKLINIAKETLNELSDSDQPFNLTMLTVDTHFEDGWLCPDCPKTFGTDRYANVMACSSKKITEFIRWCQEQPWYENTAIVLAGDHPTMDSDFCSNVSEDYERKVYTAYINSAVPNAEPNRHREYSTFDNFPTTLAALGVYIEGDRLGLGTNLFSKTETLTEKYGKHDETALLRQKSAFMNQMSGISISAKDIYKNSNALVNADIRITGNDEEAGVLSVRADDILIGNGAVYKVVFTVENNYGTMYCNGSVNPDGSYSADLPIPPDQLTETSLRIAATCRSHGKLEGGTIFGCSEGNLLYIGSLQKNAAGFIDMLNTLDPERYSVLLAAQGNVSAGISDEIQQSLYAFGCETDLKNSEGLSYIAIKDRGDVLETGAYRYLEWHGYLASWNLVVMASASESYGNTSSIMVNDRVAGYKEYSPAKSGLNFVVWDNVDNCIAASAVFDTTQVLPEADVVLYNEDPENETVEISVTQIANLADIVNVYGIVFDDNDPGKKTSFSLSGQEDGSFRGIIDTADLDLSAAHIRLMASDLSEYPHLLKKIDEDITELIH